MAVAFFGDGAVNNGAFHEGLNMASIWKLPVLFVCENNEFATEVPVPYAAGNPSVAGRGGGYGLPGVEVDGNDVLAVSRGRRRGRRARPTRRRADADRVQDLPHPAPRRGHGRLHLPHPRGRRGLEDPLPDPAAHDRDCIEERLADEPELDAIDAEVEAQIVEALQFAESSPWPDPATAADHVYAEPRLRPCRVVPVRNARASRRPRDHLHAGDARGA